MSNIIDVIEKWGGDARWRHASDEARNAALIQAGFEPSLRAAVLGEDPSLLESMVGATHNICCLVNHPEEEKEEKEDDEEEEKPGDKEESEDDEDEE